MPRYNYVRGRKFETKGNALTTARRNNTRSPQYDWYVVESTDTDDDGKVWDRWYVYRGGERPKLMNGARFIYINGVLQEPLLS